MNPKPPDREQASTPPEKKEDPGSRQTTPEDPKKPASAPFVFKIVRADPKNSFDFEDVADK